LEETKVATVRDLVKVEGKEESGIMQHRISKQQESSVEAFLHSDRIDDMSENQNQIYLSSLRYWRLSLD
ncbi:hypothetical protein J6590_094640, partial [Homalodisca vitripennis]